ncbi:MAG: cytochrome c oxidase subunit 3 [Acidobacteriia bacterium]|nr:cytochrome c oxidase subunit 3 [Terriglobia bacterium]
MTASRALDVSHLPDYSISNRAPLWWGQLLLAFIEGTMFAILIAMYFYYRLRVDVWPPPGTRMPPVVLPSVSLLLLIVSCLGSYRASESAKQDDRRAMLLWMVFNICFGTAALVVRGFDWASLNFTQAADIHGTMVWTLLGLHTLDAFADLAFTAVLILLVLLGHHSPRTRLGVHVDSVVWYFVVLIWIPLYVVIYWGPRLVGSPR